MGERELFMTTVIQKCAAIAVAVLLALGAFALTACSTETDEEVVHDGIADILEAAKTFDESLLSDMIAFKQLDELESFGIDPYAFMQAYLTDFTYTVENVRIDEEAAPNTATATVTVTTRNLNDILKTANETILNDHNLAAISELPEAEQYQFIQETLLETVADAPLITSAPFDMTYELIETTWTPTEDAKELIMEAIFGDN